MRQFHFLLLYSTCAACVIPFPSLSGENDFNKKYFYKVREILPRGSICVFPSYTWHRVSPVTKGKRLSLVQWNLGPEWR